MILKDNRYAVIKNIKTCSENGEFNKKVEINDPILTSQQSLEITKNYIQRQNGLDYRIKSGLARFIARVATKKINKTTQIFGIEKIPKDIGGAIITSNHFSPTENTVIRYLAEELKRKKLNIISQTSNFAMSGLIGFIMNYADTIPICENTRYLARDFLCILNEKLNLNKEFVLIYPEQEMWFNYRKPRPPKNGAYFFSAKLNVPIISCFVEIVDTNESETKEFNKVEYILHVLDVLYPENNLPIKDATAKLAEEDYNLKKECYERVYNKPLSYDFDFTDIAGWTGDKNEK